MRPRGVHGAQARLPARQLAYVDRMETVDVFLRGDAPKHALGVDMARQRQLDQDAVDLLSAVELLDHGHQFRRRGLCGQAQGLGVRPDAVAGADLVSDVDLGSRILADQNGGKAGANAVPCRLLDP